jgi:membrane protease YdiL (CAAX protease family)
MVVYLAWQTGAQVIAGLEWFKTGPAAETMQRQGVMGLVGYAVGIIAGVGMLHLLARSGPEAGVRFKGGDVLIGLWAFLLAWPLVEASSIGAVLVQQWMAGHAPSLAHPTLAQIVSSPNDPWRWVVIASVVLGAPIVEELVYRVFIQSAIVRVVGGVWPGVLITAAIFAGVHRVGGPDAAVPWVALAPIFVLGLAMGVAYERTKRVGVPIMMHIAFNAVNVGLAMATHGATGEPLAAV